MKFKKLLSLVLLASSSQLLNAQCYPPSTSASLSVNNVDVRINVGGDMWWDLLSQSHYEFPKGSGKNTFFAGGIWVGGLTAGDSLRVAAMMYRQNGSDFYPGPLAADGSVAQSTCVEFDRYFGMTQADIDAFLNSGIIDQTLYDWPGKGNPHNNMPTSDLAPFKDVNSDGIYNPDDGDYPVIKGDVAYWTVFNDVGNVHGETGSDPIGLEVQQMIYAYAANNVVGNSIFYDYKLIKKSPGILHSAYFGKFVDPDLGYAQDDNLASSSTKRLGVVFNGDTFDEDGGGALGYGANPPASAVKFLRTPLSDAGSMVPMSSFIHFNSFTNPFNGTPHLAHHFYSYLSGKWLDSQDIVLGGNGRPDQNPGAPVHPYMFDIDAPQDWTECAAGNSPGDRRFVMSAGAFTLDYNTPVEVSLVSYSVFPNNLSVNFSCDSLGDVLAAADTLQQFYLDHPLPDTTTNDTTVGIFDNQLESFSFTVFPNPSNGTFSIHHEANDLVSVEIFDLSGRIISSEQNISSNQRLSIHEAGVYIIRVSHGDQQSTERLVIH